MTSGKELQVGHNPATSWHCWDPTHTHTLINAYWISKRKAQKWEKWTGTSQMDKCQQTCYAESPWWIERALRVLRANSPAVSFFKPTWSTFKDQNVVTNFLQASPASPASPILIFNLHPVPAIFRTCSSSISPTPPLLAVLCIPCPTRLPHPEPKTW